MDEGLYTYIKKMRELEYDFDEIRDFLLDSGWDDSSLDKAFHDYREDHKSLAIKEEVVYEEQVQKAEPEPETQPHTSREESEKNVETKRDAEIKKEIEVEIPQSHQEKRQELPQKPVQKQEAEQGKEIKEKEGVDSNREPTDISLNDKKGAQKEIKPSRAQSAPQKKEKDQLSAGEKKAGRGGLYLTIGILSILSLLGGIALGYMHVSLWLAEMNTESNLATEEIDKSSTTVQDEQVTETLSQDQSESELILQDPLIEIQDEQGGGDDITSIENDLHMTDLETLDTELDGMMQELES